VSASKVLWGPVLVILVIVVGTTWAATQWTAWRLGFQPQLGSPWIYIGRLPVYAPPAFFLWWCWFEAYAPRVFAEGAVIAGSGGVGALVTAVAMSVRRARERETVTTYGSARWARVDEIHAAGLLGPDGVFLGRLGGKYLRHNGPEHVLCFAPPRTGKGVGLVVPTLLTWPETVIVHDIKGENYERTAGWRARFGRVLLFDPTNPESAAYNPLREIRNGDAAVRDAQNIADILVDPEGARERRDHWEKTSHSLLVGAILHVLYAETNKTLAGVAEFLSDTSRPFERTLHIMMKVQHPGDGIHNIIASTAREVLNKSENERSGVLSTAMTALALYREPVVAKVTSRSDWRIADLVQCDDPASLYLVVPASDISRTRSLLRLILNQIGRRLTEKLNDPSRRHRVLLMLDEFPALGRLDFFETALAFMAGYGLKSFLIAQSLNQIQKAYGEYNSILDNCHIRVAFATNDERTARRVSDALGTSTELRAMRNYAGSRLAPWLPHMMVSRQETARPLLTPGEVMQLPWTEEIVLVSGLAPIRAKKARYYEDPELNNRILPIPIASMPDSPEEKDFFGRSALCDDEMIMMSRQPTADPTKSGGVMTESVPREESDTENAGIRREPRLIDREAVAVTEEKRSRRHRSEQLALSFDDYMLAGDARPNRILEDEARERERLQNVARQAAMDPGDGLGL
jgi:type IV secretion system protein VirD4